MDRQTNINEGMARFIPTRVGQMLSGENNSGSVTRFIPTRVGQIQYRILVVSCVTGSSPRVWGRYIIALVCPPCQYGSSPRVWGRCPYPCSHTTSAIPVHPHACGADFYVSSFRIYPHRFIPTRVGQMIGLVCRWGRPQRFIPTRVGQIVGLRLDMHGNARFIPTRVGQMSWSEYGPFSSNTVHPHACGADIGFRSQQGMR